MSEGRVLVSVVLPAYNRASCIERSIRSVLAQTYSDFELIVVDDCSADNTEEVVAAIDDPRLTYIRLEQNAGAAGARNAGIRRAKADFIAFQDSDDVWMPHKLETQMQVMLQASAKVGVVYSRFFRCNERGEKWLEPELEKLPAGNVLEKSLLTSFVSTQVILARKECFDVVGEFDAGLRCLEDWEWVIRASAKYEFVGVEEALVNVFYSSNSITINQNRFVALSKIAEKNFMFYEQYPASAYRHLCTLAIFYYLSGKEDQARLYIVQMKKLLKLHFNAKAWLICYFPAPIVRMLWRIKNHFTHTYS